MAARPLSSWRVTSRPTTTSSAKEAGGHHNERGCERKAYDFYATPPETVRAFLANFDGISSGDRILEPSAGNGQIVKVLREGGYDNRIDAVELRPEEWGTLVAC